MSGSCTPVYLCIRLHVASVGGARQFSLISFLSGAPNKLPNPCAQTDLLAWDSAFRRSGFVSGRPAAAVVGCAPLRGSPCRPACGDSGHHAGCLCSTWSQLRACWFFITRRIRGIARLRRVAVKSDDRCPDGAPRRHGSRGPGSGHAWACLTVRAWGRVVRQAWCAGAGGGCIRRWWRWRDGGRPACGPGTRLRPRRPGRPRPRSGRPARPPCHRC